MKLRHYLLLGVLVALAACTSFTTAKEPTTVQQKYFAAKQDYATVLTAASKYSETCRAKPTKTCVKIVKQAQSADDKIVAVIKVADKVVEALKGDPSKTNEDKLAGYLGVITLGISELQAYAASTTN